MLVVDDNHDAADSLAMLLSALGYQTETAYDGADGIVRAQATLPDIVILDIDMPVMDGCQAARELRSRFVSNPPFLLALTAAGSADCRQAAAAAGFDRFFLKPINPQVLAALIDGLMSETARH